LNETFLLHLLQGYLDEVNKLTSSVTVKHLSSKTVQDLPIPLPPLLEQQRIVESVEAAFSRVDALEATIQGILERVGVFRRSVLAEAFAGRLVPQDPSDEPASVLLDRIRVDRETAKKDLERMKA
jgi:type I restriction enzyme S subunit